MFKKLAFGPSPHARTRPLSFTERGSRIARRRLITLSMSHFVGAAADEVSTNRLIAEGINQGITDA
jgi:hypothetical protein